MEVKMAEERKREKQEEEERMQKDIDFYYAYYQ